MISSKLIQKTSFQELGYRVFADRNESFYLAVAKKRHIVESLLGINNAMFVSANGWDFYFIRHSLSLDDTFTRAFIPFRMPETYESCFIRIETDAKGNKVFVCNTLVANFFNQSKNVRILVETDNTKKVNLIRQDVAAHVADIPADQTMAILQKGFVYISELNEYLRSLSIDLKKQIKPFILTRELEHCAFSTRVKNLFEKLEIRYVYELLSKTESALLNCSGLGMGAIKEIREFLAGHNLALGWKQIEMLRLAEFWCKNIKNTVYDLSYKHRI